MPNTRYNVHVAFLAINGSDVVLTETPDGYSVPQHRLNLKVDELGMLSSPGKINNILLEMLGRGLNPEPVSDLVLPILIREGKNGFFGVRPVDIEKQMQQILSASEGGAELYLCYYLKVKEGKYKHGYRPVEADMVEGLPLNTLTRWLWNHVCIPKPGDKWNFPPNQGGHGPRRSQYVIPRPKLLALGLDQKTVDMFVGRAHGDLEEVA